MSTCWNNISQRQRSLSTVLVLGMDPQPDIASVRAWGEQRLAACADRVCAVKFNLAFFLMRGASGIDALQHLFTCARQQHLPTILDAKFNDVSHSAKAYANFAFEQLQADAVTLNPLLGVDSVAAFSDYDDKAIFLLAHTSNPGAAALMQADYYCQLLRMFPQANIGLVVGANSPEVIKHIRQLSQCWLLTPGVGAQAADVEDLIAASAKQRILVPLSRSLQTENVDYWAQKLA